MRRALQLSLNGFGYTYTNPMVGAVIVAPSGKIIGEGWHRRFGGPHAEVNAINSVPPAEQHLIPQSTIYVTLEPCSHYGKTPPCAKLIIDKHIPKVVVGAMDPFPAVSGRGIRMLRDAGCEVTTGILAEECYNVNLTFMRAHEMGRPFITLKWAQSADGFIGAEFSETEVPERIVFSDSIGQLSVHRLRSTCQGIVVGTNTVISDNPCLDCRNWPVGIQPIPLLRESQRLPKEAIVLHRNHIIRGREENLEDFLRRLYQENKFNHILVEGGAETLSEFINADLFDAIRIEISPCRLGKGVMAPAFNPSRLTLTETATIGFNSLHLYMRNF